MELGAWRKGGEAGETLALSSPVDPLIKDGLLTFQIREEEMEEEDVANP